MHGPLPAAQHVRDDSGAFARVHGVERLGAARAERHDRVVPLLTEPSQVADQPRVEVRHVHRHDRTEGVRRGLQHSQQTAQRTAVGHVIGNGQAAAVGQRSRATGEQQWIGNGAQPLDGTLEEGGAADVDQGFVPPHAHAPPAAEDGAGQGGSCRRHDGIPMTARRRRVRQLTVGGSAGWVTDDLATEEPLEIRLDGEPLSVTMRTPGADFDLTVGFLVTEGIIDHADAILSMTMCPRAAGETGEYNVVEVALRRPRDASVGTRNFFMSSSCGVCGKASIESVTTSSPYVVSADPLAVDPALLATLPETLRAAQTLFRRTGGLHAAAIFTASGELVCVREDVGRHNAFDKVIGWAATQRRLPLTSHIILASGRASFELTQKALMAGIPLLAAVSAPSSLAVELAERAGMTLVGFLRGERMNVYTGHHRLRLDSTPLPMTS